MRPRLTGGGQIGGLGCRKAWIRAERAAYQWDSKIWGWIPNGLGLHDTSRSGVDKIDGRMDAETSILQDDFLRTVEFMSWTGQTSSSNRIMSPNIYA